MQKTKKHLSIFILLCVFVASLALPVMAENTNVLKNGSFEEVAGGMPTNWSLDGAKIGDGFEVVTEGAAEGKNAIRFTSTGNNIYVAAMANVVGGTDYTFSAMLKTKGSGTPAIKLTYQRPNGKGSHEIIEEKWNNFSTKRRNVWEQVTYTSKAPTDATRVILMVRLLNSGECFWDDVKLTGAAADTDAAASSTTPTAGSSAALTAPADNKYEQAETDAVQTISATVEENGTFNLLQNGDFETVSSSGLPTGWALTGGAVYSEAMTAKGDAPSGENFLRFFGDSSSIYVSTIITNVIAEETYHFSAYIRKMAGTKGTPQISLIHQKPSGNSHATIETIYENFSVKEDTWEKVEKDVEIPAETTRTIILVRLIGGGELHWDNIKFVGNMVGNTGFSVLFRNMLAEEAKTSQTVTKELGDPNEESEPFPGQPDNILENGSFDENNGKTITSWSISDAHSSYGSIVPGGGHDGGDAIRLQVPTTDGLKNPFYKQNVKIVGGAEYQVSFWYKIPEGVTGSPAIKLEYFMDSSLPGAGSCGEKYVSPSAIKDGQWHRAHLKVYPPTNAAELSVLARLMQNAEGQPTETCIDDVAIYMTAPPSAMTLNTEQIFFYNDTLDKTATFKGNVNLSYFPELSNAMFDFQVYRQDKLVWETKDVMADAGTASAVFPLSVLTEWEKPYCVKATMYNADGTVADVQTQNIYVYARPEYLGADGIFSKDGEPFYPVLGYHVWESGYQKAAEAGINLVQMGAFGKDVEAAVNALDCAEEAGIKGFICLYNGMKPAGHESNIDSTIALLSDERIVNHPALYGYCVMDEVYLNIAEPEPVMEASFRLIRALDPKHPIVTMEAVSNYYADCAKFVDTLFIDPYSAAQLKNASISSDRARAAVNYLKPVYAVLETYYTTHGRWPSPEDARNNNYQALIAGADAVGYFSISDADIDPETGKNSVAIWDARDGGALYNALREYGTREKQITYDHFVFNKSPEFNEFRGDEYWYSSWVADGSVYMVVLGMKLDQKKEVCIPLESFAGDVKIGAYTAEVIAGRSAETIRGNGTFDMTVNGIEAVLYKITPDEPVDFSPLGITKFEDLENHNWARQQIAHLDSLGIVDGRSDWEYAPAENITRAEFAAFLVRTLGLTSDSTENFADIDKNHPYAKEIAIGRANGILNGIGDNLYNPEATITRQDMMTIISRGMNLSGSADLSAFSDADAVADYAAEHVSAMVASGLIQGNADGTINPLGNTTRAEAAVIMERILAQK